MRIVNVHEAQTQLCHLMEQACAGEEIVIARNNEPVVKLLSVQEAPPRRQRGSLEGQAIVPESFFDSLPTEDLDT